jgi:ribonuclease D
MDVKGINILNDSQRAVLKRLFALRERLAKKVDRPVHFIMSTKMLVDVARSPPKDIHQWQIMKGVHPIVKRSAGLFVQEINQGQNEKVPLPPVQKKRFTIYQQRTMQLLSEKRDALAEKIGISAHLIMNKEQMKDIVISGNYKPLKNWQKKVLGF